MCGVIGLSCAKDREDLGEVASRLLRMLEYRGYDSTGALVQDSSGRIFLKKDVGAPTVITKKLGIDKLSGKLFCGQVRWATFGVVTKENAQPHEVSCHTHLYGAHNGNITNCDQLKDWLLSAGHDVKSDNDGEMLVHTIEHFFAIELKKLKSTKDKKQRYGALKKAILAASRKTTGSFAAVVVDPVTELMACIKAGSSLYMGGGRQDGAGSFIIASSDLAGVLSMTKMLYPIKEDEFALYTPEKADFFGLRTGRPVPKEKTRSHLRVEETELKKPFKYFMEQEIFGEVEAAGRVINYFADRSPVVDLARKASAKDPGLVKELKKKILALSSVADAGKFKKEAASFLASAAARKALSFAGGFRPSLNTLPLESFLADLLEEVNGAGASAGSGQAVKFADALFLLEEIEDIKARVAGFVERMAGCRKNGRTAYFVACGTSYNAAKCASVFFNKIAGVNTIFGMEGVGALVDKFADSIKFAVGRGGNELKGESLHRIFRAVSDYAFFDLKPRELSREEGELFSSIFRGHNFFESMYTNYPLVFITGPNSRDVNLTISQINTHKIRGANIYVIAEEDALLRDAARKSVPSMYSKTYKYGYIALPRTGDDLLVFFTSSVVLQVLALEMSVRKMKFLDRLEIRDHGVHPDSPKNVSKSITVD